MKKIFILFCFPLLTMAQHLDPLLASNAQEQSKWVDSIYNAMTLDEKIGQLFMIQVFSSQNKKETEGVKNLIKKHHIGGIIFSKGGPVRQAKLTNIFQKEAKTPLFIGMDAEWGLAMRLDSVYAFPFQMTLGALKNNALVERTGKHIAQHCKRLGVHINFTPSVDINTNAQNPIIGTRSFGESKFNVAKKGAALIQGLQSEKVLGSAKHFPGHGDTSKDSHLTLPTVNFTQSRLQEVEFYPFKEAINRGVATIMVGHLNVPSLDNSGVPSSLSYEIVTNILKNKLGFKGIIVSDALGMKGVANTGESSEVDLKAFLAGNDLLLMSENPIKGMQRLKKAYHDGQITEERLAHSVKKILKGKYWAGLNQLKPVELKNLYADLNKQEDEILTENIYKEAITVVKNTFDVLPLRELKNKKTAYIKFGDDSGWEFFKNLRYYDDVAQLKSGSWASLSKEIAPYDRVVIGVHRSSKTPWQPYDLTKEELFLLDKIAQNKQVILTFFVKPYALAKVNLRGVNAIVMAYQNDIFAQQKAAQLIYGALEGKGVLPVSAHPEIPLLTSISTRNIGRLAYTLAENVGLSSKGLSRIDSVVERVITQKMAPSVQVLVARRGAVVYNKSFGYHTYEKKDRTYSNSIYDLASLTKILSTIPVMMQLYDKQQISLDNSFSELLPELKETNKAEISVKEALSHYGRLRSWIPFYKNTLENGTLSKSFYRKQASDEFNTKVAENVFIKKGYDTIIFNSIAQSELLSRRRYNYSDLSYYLFQTYIERKKKKPLNEIVADDFYREIGAYQLTYLPLQKFSKEQIIPSENDTVFRGQVLQGNVNDQGAAMLGGVGGHAGLFGSANDVAKVMQMFLQKGYYGGVRYFSEKTFNEFNTTYFAHNRRALGFDKPQPQGEKGPTCGCVSAESFGHSGFTGTYTWADPKTELLYVFLSNRTFPSASNKKLINENIRSKIQQIIVESITDEHFDKKILIEPASTENNKQLSKI